MTAVSSWPHSMFRRGIYILLLVLAMLAGYLCLHLFRDASAPLALARIHLIEGMAVVASLAAGGVGMAGMMTLRRRCNAMAVTINKAVAAGKLESVDCPDPDLQ